MPSRPIAGVELDLAQNYAIDRFGIKITQRNIEKVGIKVQNLRENERLDLKDALEQALDHYKLQGARRGMYKATLGKLFNSRRKSSKRGKIPRRNKVSKPSRKTIIPTILEGNQYAIVMAALK